VKPPDFDLGNSPAEILERDGLAGRTIVLRSTAGTRSALAALESGASPLYVAALVTAPATAAALARHDTVTIVAAGQGGEVPAEEDEVTADYLERAYRGEKLGVDALVARAREGAGAIRLRESAWAHPTDLELCLAVGRFPFALEARRMDGRVAVFRV
jgi:2-phosphosulfolactate phosphatase